MISVKDYVKIWKSELATKARSLNTSLAIIQVGDNEASSRYVRNKIKDCNEVGIVANLYKLEENVVTDDVINLINNLKEDGIIVQLPLPKHLNIEKITEAIPLEKDVDGFKVGTDFTPCTPGGIIKYLEFNNYDFEGKNAVVIGRSNIVGKPIAKLLLDKDCSVTILHSKSNPGFFREALHYADLVICAVGKRGIIHPSMAPNAFIIDVGINFDEAGKLCGDVEIISDRERSRVTPVPGGVGLLTRCMLLNNTIVAAEKNYEKFR